MEQNNKITVLFVMTACKKSGPVQQMLNIIKNLDNDKFKPVLLTIYPEPKDGTSQLDYFVPYVKHYFVNTNKLNIILGRTRKLKEFIRAINPDVIHTLGVFPDYAISNIGKYPNMITLRNYVWEDYPAKFGRIRGYILAKIHLYAMKRTSLTLTCSKSLAEVYEKKLNLKFRYIQNGVDIQKFNSCSNLDKFNIRKELSLPINAFIFIYSGQFIKRKNIEFLLRGFLKKYDNNKNVWLVLLGDGPLLHSLKEKYKNSVNIIFKGLVDNVNQYVKASDAYLSCSYSEGLPNGVLEAMASGLPVVLSDIKQHQEIYEYSSDIGYLYQQDNLDDYMDKLTLIVGLSRNSMIYKYSNSAKEVANTYFSDKTMSMKYQHEYFVLAKTKQIRGNKID